MLQFVPSIGIVPIGADVRRTYPEYNLFRMQVGQCELSAVLRA